jgi:hypothetical protein
MINDDPLEIEENDVHNLERVSGLQMLRNMNE